MVGGGLAGGVGGVRRVGRLLAEGTVGAEAPVHFVGRHVEEAERLARAGRAAGEVCAGAVQQFERPDRVRVDERTRPVDRPVDVRLGGEVDHGGGPVLAKYRLYRLGIGDVAAHEGVARVRLDVAQVREAAGIGQLVEDDHAGLGTGERQPDEITADEARPAGDEPAVHSHRVTGGPEHPPIDARRPPLPSRRALVGGPQQVDDGLHRVERLGGNLDEDRAPVGHGAVPEAGVF